VAPAALIALAPKKSQSPISFTPGQVLSSPVFYVMYAMFVLVAAGGLALIPNIKPIANDWKVAKTSIDFLGMTVVAGTFAISMQRVFDGIGRPFFGWTSDHIGRENTMAIAFLTGSGALLLMSQFGTNPMAFVLVTPLYFFVFGEIYSLFPATQGDTYGARYAAANAGMLYTAKGTATLLVPVATAFAVTHGWNAILHVAMCGNLVAAALALLVLKPMRVKHFEKIRAQAAGSPAPGAAAPGAT